MGILGGGQLGRMLAVAGAPMGVRLKALDPTENAPASIAATQVVGSFRDEAAVKAFAETCDVVTVEIEHIDVEALRQLAAAGVDVQPTPETLATIQDKYAQKVHFTNAGVPLGPYADCPDAEALERAANEFGFPLMLKSKRLAYDGRGNAVAKTADDLNDAVSKLGGFEQGLYCEKWVPFEKELAVMVVRARDGETRAYPVVETVHENNICDTTTTPAPVPNKVAEAVQEAAKRAVASFTGAGIFGVELFLLKDGSILLNECAPRPHNSGHYTIEGCACSQYENHLRAILGWPLGDTSLKVGGAVMKNILGDGEGDEAMGRAHRLMGAALATPGASIHWYEKPDMKLARKMGHLTVVGSSAAVATERLDTILRAAKGDTTPAKKAPQVGIIMGSDSDLPTMSAAAEVLESFGIGCEVTVISAHRTPERMNETPEARARLARHHCRRRRRRAPPRHGGRHDPASGDRRSRPLKVSRRHGLPPFHRANAQGRSGGHGGHWQQRQRRSHRRANRLGVRARRVLKDVGLSRRHGERCFEQGEQARRSRLQRVSQSNVELCGVETNLLPSVPELDVLTSRRTPVSTRTTARNA